MQSLKNTEKYLTKLYPKLAGLAIGIQMFFVYNKQALERWPSGLRRTPGTRVGVQASRRFESCSLRQKKNFALITTMRGFSFRRDRYLDNFKRRAVSF